MQKKTDKDSAAANTIINDWGETNCIYKKSSLTPEKTDPFNKCDKIELIAYEPREVSYKNDQLIIDGNFIVKNIKQRITLDNIQRDSLFAILYNYSTNRFGNVSFSADCYTPRHSIVFYKNGEAIAFYEICFACYGTRQTKGIPYIDFCDDKWCLLQRFFKDAKINRGIYDEFCPD